MYDKELSIQYINGKNYICPSLLEKILNDRDEKIKRIEQATETRRKQCTAKTKEELDSIPVPDDFKIFGECAKWVMESYISGFALSDDDRTPRCYYGNMGALASILCPELYRGEICDYGETSGYSSLGRFIHNTRCYHKEERYIQFFIGQMRIICFHAFLTLFRQYVEFPFGAPLAGVIAQHYGLDTQFLDVTDDVKVALFFACCKHIGNNKYRPIIEDDLNDLGTQAVLYFGSDNFAKIIGYQPFCRCHKQRGYYIDTDITSQCWSQSMLSTLGYTKCYFDRTPELSNRIFDEFAGGKVLFPEDGLSQFSDEIKQIRVTNIFPIDAFNKTFYALKRYFNLKKEQGLLENNIFNLLSNKEWMLNSLKDKGYTFDEKLHIHSNNKEIITQLNRNWSPEKFADREGILYTPFMVLLDEENQREVY